MMRIQSSVPCLMWRRFGVAATSICLASILGLLAAAEPVGQKKPTADELSLGQEIFLREWVPNDSRSHGGDGLGPVFNDSSCIACHNLGGAGGGGPASKNVDIISAVPASITALPTNVLQVSERIVRAGEVSIRTQVVPANALQDNATPEESGRDDASNLLAATMRFVNGFRVLVGSPMIPVRAEPKSEQRINVDELAKLHPGFRTARSIVLPRFGTEPEFEKWHPASSNSLAAFPASEMPVLMDPTVASLDVEAAELHPVFRKTFGILLRHFGLESQFEKLQMASSDAGAVQTAPTLQMNTAGEPAPNKFWQKIGASFDILGIRQPVAHAAQQFIDLAGMAFLSADPESADFGTEFGMAQEALLARSLRNMGARPDLLTMSLDENTSPFGSTGKKANAVFVASHRNPTALFGSGLIDGIPDLVIEEAATTKYRDFPAVTGRVSRLRDGRIGKFGWKGQTASLRDFTLTACAVELGLNVPGHEQAVAPYKPEYRSPGLDLTGQECDALVAFLASLPAPTRSRQANADHTVYLEAGEKLFTDTGCAACHSRKLGDVDSIYSDLLLHDMGPALADSGIYGTIFPETPDENDVEPAAAPGDVSAATNGQPTQVSAVQPTKSQSRSPRRSEWRTPPLWGVRDSGPYLHDGSAETIQDAIAMHGGEALPSTNRYFKLPHEKRQQLIGFLKSLTAPQADASR